ncbi:MAG TPA: glycoside hydrolase family 2 TIM barrel-domain containing protein, partial [Chitinophagaceae bacterium]
MILRPISISLLLMAGIVTTVQAQSTRIIQPFDKDWHFNKGDSPGAEAPAFSDASWRTLDVPHDWSIEGPYDRNNPTGRGGGYLPSGIGWYRKTFTLDNAPKDSRVFIEFDGVMANSDVWINGYHLEKRPNGYVAFQYELTDHVNAGKQNVLAVRADNSLQPASRWYTGAGIYRHVRLVITSPVHVAHWGSFITSSVAAGKATVQVQTTIDNQSASSQSFILQTALIAPDGKTVATVSSAAQKIAAGASAPVLQKLPVNAPKLWGLDNPQLYKAVTTVLIDKKKSDEVTVPFGIRDARFDAATGFWLNGQNLKIKGVCMHHDGGAVGAAVPLRVWERRLEILKSLGVNAIRTSHNAVAPEFLDLCDRMGLLVMAETFDTWTAKKSSAENGYNLYFNDWWEKDTHDIVLNARNHPSIVIYSVGNEIHDNLNDADGLHKYLMQQDLIHSLDTTRPVTMALFRPGVSHVYENGLADKMDVVGQNYRENELVAAHQAKPQRKVIGTENGHTMSAWLALRDNAFMSGQFLWVGIDYLGEADWPKVVNGQGLLDRTGGARIIAYQRQSWWSDKPMVYVMRKEQNAGA